MFDELVPIEVTRVLAGIAGDIAEALSLRGYDAVHVAAAYAIGDPELILVTWDRKLADAARNVGLTTIAG